MPLTRQVLAGLLIGLLTFVAVWHPPEQAPLAVESVDDESPRLRILGNMAMEEVTRDVAAGRRSLAEAAALFGELGHRNCRRRIWRASARTTRCRLTRIASVGKSSPGSIPRCWCTDRGRPYAAA
jgi:hypothetical protein